MNKEQESVSEYTNEQSSIEQQHRLSTVTNTFKELFTTNCIDNNEALELCINAYLTKPELYEYAFNQGFLNVFLNSDFVCFLENISEYTGVTEIMTDSKNELENFIKQFICKAIQMRTYNDSSYEYLFKKLVYGYTGELRTIKKLENAGFTLLEGNDYILPKGSYDLLVEKNGNQYKVEVKVHSVEKLRLNPEYSGTKYVRLHSNQNTKNKWDILVVCSYEKENLLQPVYMVFNKSMDNDWNSYGLLLYSIQEYDKGWWVAHANRTYIFIDDVPEEFNFKKLVDKLDFTYEVSKRTDKKEPQLNIN